MQQKLQTNKEELNKNLEINNFLNYLNSYFSRFLMPSYHCV